MSAGRQGEEDTTPAGPGRDKEYRGRGWVGGAEVICRAEIRPAAVCLKSCVINTGRAEMIGH